MTNDTTRSSASGTATWAELDAAAPDVAAHGVRLFDRDGIGQGFLATVRSDAPPRINPIYVAVVDGHLVSFVLASAKRTDLEQDGRYALHTFQDATTLDEFSVRGTAVRVADRALRERAAAAWAFAPDDSYDLYEFLIERALLGQRASDAEWPPRYSTWPPRSGVEAR